VAGSLASLNRKRPVATVDERIFAPDGEIRWQQWTNRAVFDDAGELVEYQAVGRDITDQKRAEEEFRREHAFVTSLIDTAHTIILVLDPEGKIVSFNPHMAGVCGYALAEVKGRDWFDVLVPEHDRKRVRSVFRRTEAGTGGVINPIVTRDGRERQIEWYNRTLKDAEGKVLGVLATGQDVTERRQAEELMLERSRLEVTETLAGGIAHDFNNLLTGVLGNAELLKMTYGDNADAMKMVEGITKSARRAVELAQQLVAFARGGKYQIRVLNLNDIVLETVDLLHGAFPPGVIIKKDLAPNLVGVEVDPGQIRQVVMNLLTNAVEAVGDTGRVTLTTYNCTTARPVDGQYAAVRPGPCVCLSVGDTGPGMDADTLARVFEPFYSTKSSGRGLGLAAAYGIVKNHGGLITAHTEVGVGTLFLVQLPAVTDPARQAKAREHAADPDAVTVLVVDDEQTVLDVTRRMVRHLGYTVLTAADGRDALDLVETHDGQIDLVILDVEMPVMSGAEAYPLLVKARPDVKVIISSGYELDAECRRLLDAGADAFLQKPFCMDALSKAMRDVLGG